MHIHTDKTLNANARHQLRCSSIQTHFRHKSRSDVCVFVWCTHPHSQVGYWLNPNSGQTYLVKTKTCSGILFLCPFFLYWHWCSVFQFRYWYLLSTTSISVPPHTETCSSGTVTITPIAHSHLIGVSVSLPNLHIKNFTFLLSLICFSLNWNHDSICPYTAQGCFAGLCCPPLFDCDSRNT